MHKFWKWYLIGHDPWWLIIRRLIGSIIIFMTTFHHHRIPIQSVWTLVDCKRMYFRHSCSIWSPSVTDKIIGKSSWELSREMHQNLTDLKLFWIIFKIKQGHKKFTFRSSMKRRRRLWRNCKTMTAGSSSRNRSWSSRPSSRSSGSRRPASRTTRPTSGTTWRSATPRRRGSCLEPRPPPALGPAWPTSGLTRARAGQAAIRAPVTAPGPRTPPPTRPRPPGPGRHRTPGPPPTGTRRRRRGARWPTTGTPSSCGSCSLHVFIVAFLLTNLWTHHHALSLDGSAFLNF